MRVATSPSQAEEMGLEPVAGSGTMFGDVGGTGRLPWLERGACRQTLPLRCPSLSQLHVPSQSCLSGRQLCPAPLLLAAGNLDAF